LATHALGLLHLVPCLKYQRPSQEGLWYFSASNPCISFSLQQQQSIR